MLLAVSTRVVRYLHFLSVRSQIKGRLVTFFTQRLVKTFPLYMLLFVTLRIKHAQSNSLWLRCIFMNARLYLNCVSKDSKWTTIP